ncbi:MAG: hypothetical protein ACWA6Y_14255 [Polaromonas sp.]
MTGFQPFLFATQKAQSEKAAATSAFEGWFFKILEKRLKESFFQCFLNPDCRKRLGSGDVQRVAVRHGW